MSEFREILEIEKKYEHIVNSAKKTCESEFEKFKEELKLKEDAFKEDYRKELERDYKKKSLAAEAQGKEMLKKSKANAEYTLDKANRDAAKRFLLECVENV